MHTFAWLIAIRICLFKLKFHAIYPFMVKNTSYNKNVKYLEEVYGEKKAALLLD